jgi:hypothetical protein
MTGFDVSLSRKENRMIDVTIYESGQKNKQIKKELHFCDFQQTLISFIQGTVIPNARRTEEAQPSVTEHSARQNNTQGDSSFRFGMTGFDISLSRKENRMIDVTIFLLSLQKNNCYETYFYLTFFSFHCVRSHCPI